MRNFEPKVNIGVLLAFEKMTGVASLSDPNAIAGSLSNLTALLYCAVKHQYPRLSFDKFSADLTPAELGDAIPKVVEELTNFFHQFNSPKEQDQEQPEQLM